MLPTTTGLKLSDLQLLFFSSLHLLHLYQNGTYVFVALSVLWGSKLNNITLN